MYGSSSHADEHRDYYWRLAGKIQPAFPKRAIVVAFVVTLLLWLTAISSGFAYDLGLLIGIGFLAALAIMIGAEFYDVLIITYRVTSLLASHHWELLRLTPLPPERIFADLYVSLQLRCRKATIVEVAARVIPVLLIALSLLIEEGFLTYLFSFYFLWFLAADVLLYVFVIEPIWRFYAVVATSMAVAAKVKKFLFAALAGIAAVGAMHVLQVVIVVLTFWLVLFGARAFLGWLCFLPFTIILQIGVIFWLYRQIRNRALAFAQREMFRLE